MLTFLLALTFPSSGFAQTVTVTNTTYTSGQNLTVTGTTINTSSTVIVSSGANVKFKASGSSPVITLSPGFSSANGSVFRAFIFVDTDGDGIDDAWETAHGLNPNNAADAQTATTAGLTYLLEYLLGTNPSTAKTTDTSNTNALKIHRPNNP